MHTLGTYFYQLLYKVMRSCFFPGAFSAAKIQPYVRSESSRLSKCYSMVEEFGEIDPAMYEVSSYRISS